MSTVSAAGTYLAFNAAAPKFADLGSGHAYAITLVNSTAADITSGEFTIEAADAKADDACAPDVWGPLDVVPECTAAPGTVGGPATITLSPEHPIKANSQCSYSAACPKQFIRVAGTPGGLDIIVVVTRLKRTA